MEEVKIPVETYSRVCGYYRPTQQWNPGKRQEFKDRKVYHEDCYKTLTSDERGD